MVKYTVVISISMCGFGAEWFMALSSPALVTWRPYVQEGNKTD